MADQQAAGQNRPELSGGGDNQQARGSRGRGRGGRSGRGGGRGSRSRGGRGRDSRRGGGADYSSDGQDTGSRNDETRTNGQPGNNKKDGKNSGNTRGGGRGGRGRSSGSNAPPKDTRKTPMRSQSASVPRATSPPGRPARGGDRGKGRSGRGRGRHPQTSLPKSPSNDDIISPTKNQTDDDHIRQAPNRSVSLPGRGKVGGPDSPKKNQGRDASKLVPPSQPQQTSDKNYGRGKTIEVLHIAEKPSIGSAIANGLCTGKPNSRSRALPVHEFSDPPFPKAPHAAQCKHRVTSVAGHVFSTDFPNEYQSWDSVDPAELFEAPIVRKPCKGSVVKHLQDEAKGADFIVLWMDCDREGENINFEVLDCCMHLMKPGGSHYDRVYRAYFSAINPTDIQKAYQSLGKPDKNQSLSVDARQELDLKVGVAFSRFQTRFFQGRYGDLDSSVLSYGPCQTPTLGFCVQRHLDIESFKPEPYWTLELGVKKRGHSLRALWDAGRSFNKGKVEKLVMEAVESGAVAIVRSVVTKDKKQGRPVPLNTVALLKACSKALGIGPHSAMQTAERLYLSGYLSYPRTESTAYPKSFDIYGMLKQQASDSRWGAYVRELLEQGPNKSRGGVDMGDHPPITPCRAAGRGELSGDMERVYELVVRHCIASVSKDAVWRSTRVEFSIDAMGDKGGFTLRGKEPVSPGFLAVLKRTEYTDEPKDDGDEEEEEEKSIPEFQKGEVIPLMNRGSTSNSSKVAVEISGTVARANLEIKERKTVAPGYLTESELITLMEKNGIGTDASIPTHIENIQKRKYAYLESGRRLVPSKLGLVLVQGYHRIDISLVLPQVRSDIEDQCNKIAKGQATRDVVVLRAIQLFKSKFELFVSSIEKMDVLFGSSFSKLEDTGKPFTRCGLTRRYLSYIPGPPVRLYNKYTETVYPLPSGGIVKQWTGRSCPVKGCGFELCLYSVGQPQRTFPLCPRCFNDPDWALDAHNLPDDPIDREDEAKERQIKKIAGRSLVLECPLPDHHPLIDDLAVSPDPDSDGVLILDPHLGPKWRLVSTRDPTIVHLPQSIDKITVLDRKDDVLGIHLMQIQFKTGSSPLADGSTKYVSCFPTDEVLQPLVRVFHGSERLKASGRGGRGRGRGRGGSGRGRGRGRGGSRR